MLENLRKSSTLKIVLIVTGLVGFIMLLYARSNIFISDTAWHIKVGEWIADNKTFPKFDSFSLLSSNLNLNFVAHEWLFGFIAYWIDSLFSLNGLIIITTLFVFYSYIFSIFKSGKKLPALLVSILFIFFQFTITITCRPAIFSAILVVYLGYLFAYENKKIKKYIIILLGMIFLANFQGGFATVTLIQFLWITICKFIINKKIDRDTLLLLGASIISTFINPYGVGIHKYIVVTSKNIAIYNTDYSPFSFSTLWQLGIVFLIIILSVVGYTKKKERNILDLLIIFMFLAMALYYKRTLDMFNYAFIIYMSKYLSWLFEKRLVKNIGYTLVNVFSICLFFLVISHENLPNKSTEDYIREDIIGVDIIKELDGKRYFNSMQSGGYLIYLDSKPFIDTRNDVYTEEFGNIDLFEASVKAIHSESLMYRLTEKYKLPYLLLEKNSLTSQIFYASGLWEVDEESQNYVLFKKAK